MQAGWTQVVVAVSVVIVVLSAVVVAFAELQSLVVADKIIHENKLHGDDYLEIL